MLAATYGNLLIIRGLRISTQPQSSFRQDVVFSLYPSPLHPRVSLEVVGIWLGWPDLHLGAQLILEGGGGVGIHCTLNLQFLEA